MTGPLIEPTDEMLSAFREAVRGGGDSVDDIRRDGLAAVLAIVARDYTITPKHTPAQQCGSCGAWYDPPAVHTCAQCPACTSPYPHHRFALPDQADLREVVYCDHPWHDADAVTSGTYTRGRTSPDGPVLPAPGATFRPLADRPPIMGASASVDDYWPGDTVKAGDCTPIDRPFDVQIKGMLMDAYVDRQVHGDRSVPDGPRGFFTACAQPVEHGSTGHGVECAPVSAPFEVEIKGIPLGGTWVDDGHGHEAGDCADPAPTDG